jgi:rod shape determining protein RodA
MIKTIFGAILHYFRKLDKGLFAAVCSLGALSVVLMYALVDNGVTSKSTSMYVMQFACLCVGAGVALVMSGLDYHWFSKLWFLYAPIAVGITLLTFTSLGYQPNANADDVAWLDLGFTTFQPSEFLKIAFIMTFAIHLDKVKDKLNHFLNVVLLCIHGAVPVIIVMLQGDDGTAMIFLIIFAFMIFAAGISWKYIIPVLCALPFGIWFVWEKLMQPHQKRRILVLFAEDPINDPEYTDIFYQQYWGRLALGSGQLFGKGLHADSYVSVPYVQNDFIFTFVGQCFGFIGCVALIAVLAYVCLKILADSRIAKDTLGRYICVGVFAMIFTHCVLNIGMVLVVLPVIGVPLPFVSQGGTSMVSMFVSIGLVMSVYSHSEKNYRVFYDGK